jgi:hypothetical protein
MSIQIQGNSGTIAEVDGTLWRASRVTDRPVEYGAGGYYHAVVSASTAAAPGAGANLVSFRWTSASLLCLVRSVSVTIQVSTASTAGLPEFAGFIARSFTASDSAGTAVTLTGNSFKKRTSMATTALGDFRFASATTLTAGTRTLDSQSFIDVNTPIALGSEQTQIWGIDGPGDHPIVLAQNEGLVFQNVTALTSAVYKYTVTIHWSEVPSY